MSAPPQPAVGGRRRRVLGGVSALVAIVVLGLPAWGLLWPAPMTPLTCAGQDGEECVAASGRIVWIPRSDRRNHAEALHFVLLSRDSVAAPGITLVKISPEMRPRRTPRPGRWVSVVGVPHVGSNGLDDITVSRYVLSP